MKYCIRCGSATTAESWQCKECGFLPEVRDGIPHFAPEFAAGDKDFPLDAHAALAKLERRSFWFASRNRILAIVVRRFFPHTDKFFEVGCGTGVVLEHFAAKFPNLSLTGGEMSATGLAIARDRVPRAVLLQLDAMELPFLEEFDLIGMFDVLEHIEDDALALCQLHQGLKRSGGLILTVPQHPWLWSEWDTYSQHKRRYRRADLRSKVMQAGFEVLWMGSIFSLLLPLLAVCRLSKRVVSGMQGPQADPLEALRLSAPANAVLDGVCRLEFGLVAGGLSLPFGGSLLCVARKR